MTSVVRSWRSLKDASIASMGATPMLKLVWLVESIVRVPGEPVVGGGDRGFTEKRRHTETVELVPWSAALYDAFHAEGDRLLSEDQVAEILKARG